MKIYDCFSYWDEDLLLDLRFNILDKQKKGKARGKQFGKVEIPQEAFIGVLKINKEK